MSKSIKKSPMVRQDRPHKKICNQTLRSKTKDIDYSLSGSGYKKFVGSDNWKYIWTKEDAIVLYTHSSRSEYLQSIYPTLNDYLEYWQRCCVRK